MKLKYLLVASVFSCGVAGQTLAADMVRRVPMPIFTWLGGYLGANIGYARNKYELNEGSVKANLGLVGVFAGYNFDFYGLVASLEGGIDYYGLGKVSMDTWGDNGHLGRRLGGDVRLRLGYVIGKFLPFVSGGAAYSHLRLRLDEEPQHKYDLMGWTAGVGLDYAFNHYAFARLEYRYNSTARHRLVARWDVEGHEIRLGIAMKY